MLSLFSSAKPFRGEAAVHQRNALESWARLGPEVEVLLFGNDYGARAVSAALGLRHFPEVASNEWGTPLLSDMFAQAQVWAVHDIVCYVNADIILLGDFLDAVGRVSQRFRRFVMVGRRWDLDFDEQIAFASGWDAEIRRRCEREGILSDPTALDFFAFSRGIFPDFPPFAIGRPAWDNWLVMETLARRIPLIDVGDSVQVIHQNHGYGHVPQARGVSWDGPEGDANIGTARSSRRSFNPAFYSVLSATHVLRDGRIRRAWSQEHLSWRLWVLNCRIRKGLRPFVRFFRLGGYWARRVVLEARGRRAARGALLLLFRERSSIRRRLLRGDNVRKLLRRSESVLARRRRAVGSDDVEPGSNGSGGSNPPRGGGAEGETHRSKAGVDHGFDS
jgi:hypothetical protein